jgi:hypothetical protein
MNGDVKQAVDVFRYHGVVIELPIVVIRRMNEIAVCRKLKFEN